MYSINVNIVFKLGDNLEIDYDKSIVKLNNDLCDDKTMIIDEVIKNIFINKDKIDNSYIGFYNTKTIFKVKGNG